MQQENFIISQNSLLAKNTWRMVLRGNTGSITSPGQFVNIALPGCFLRRPVSISDWTDNEITLIYKVVGSGTELLSKMPAGQSVDLLVGLGNGFCPDKCGDRPMLVGGGVGTAPLLGLARCLIQAGKNVQAILGFNTGAEAFGLSELQSLGVSVSVATVDGTLGQKGFPTQLLENRFFSDLCVCGPEPFLRSVYHAGVWPGQYSLETRMGCGFGACMGCTIQTKQGPIRLCREGPVIDREALLWND